jgi:hypothetical protein
LTPFIFTRTSSSLIVRDGALSLLLIVQTMR